MSKNKHTPGPWTYQQFHEHDEWYIGCPVVDEMVAMVVSNSFLPVGSRNAEANARLIAAAPDLLEAALIGKRRLDHQCEWSYCGLGNEPDGIVCDCEYGRICAAIDKAEGIDA